MAEKGQDEPDYLVPGSGEVLREQWGPVRRLAAGVDGLPPARSGSVNTDIRDNVR